MRNAMNEWFMLEQKKIMSRWCILEDKQEVTNDHVWELEENKNEFLLEKKSKEQL